ncbi:hypothetical protein MUP95_08775 [bacterium]|nr:hypothetical protein [bacterium]
MDSSKWEEIKTKIKKGVAVAADKTEEYAKIGKIKLDIVKIDRNIDKAFSDLGKEAYNHFTDGKKTDIFKNAQVKGLITKINDLKVSIQTKENEIKSVKKEASSKSNKEVKE